MTVLQLINHLVEEGYTNEEAEIVADLALNDNPFEDQSNDRCMQCEFCAGYDIYREIVCCSGGNPRRCN